MICFGLLPAARLATETRALGLTQAEVAERIGVSQAQIARIEKQGCDSYAVNTLRRYVNALGDGFLLEVAVRTPLSKKVRRRAKAA